jgi:prepilin peptidase CpaA
MNVAVLATHHSREGLQPHPDLNISNNQTLRLPYALAIAGGCILTLYFQVQGV